MPSHIPIDLQIETQRWPSTTNIHLIAFIGSKDSSKGKIRIGGFECPRSSALQQSAPVLLLGGGVFFIFLFCHWLFLEPKKFGLPGESIFARQSAWFYAVVSLFLMIIVWFALEIDPMLTFGDVVGSTAFFILKMASAPLLFDS